jgi:hypothetical protein
LILAAFAPPLPEFDNLMRKERNMKLTQKSGATMAIAAAALIMSGAMRATPAAAAGEKGHCMGANACKGQAACKTAKNECKGQNACKGQGYLEMTEEECSAAGGTFEKS